MQNFSVTTMVDTIHHPNEFSVKREICNAMVLRMLAAAADAVTIEVI